MDSKNKYNNEYLLSLDMTNAAAEQKIAWLNQIIENELSKEDADDELISVCSDYLAELCAEKIPAEELSDRLAEIKSKGTQKSIIIHKKRRIGIKIIAAIAAVLMLSVASLSVMAKANGYSSTWEFINNNAKRIFDMKPGDVLTENGYEIMKNLGFKTYQTTEELLNEEDINIIYPTKLPNGIKLKNITVIETESGKFIYCFTSTSNNLSFSLYTSYEFTQEDLAAGEVYATALSEFYIFRISDHYMATTQREGFEYSIIFNDYDGLILILDNLKN